MRWYISDTHFGHKNIIDYCRRPFANVDEMNEAMIDIWNANVHPLDTVYHLGDVALGKIAESLPLIGLLNGYKILVPGNHDRIFSGEKEKTRVRYMPEYRKVFQEIRSEITETDIGGRKVLLSHFPYHGDSQENDRHLDKRPEDRGQFLVHGHIHDLRRIDGRMFNVGVDAPGNDFVPVHEEEIIEWMARGDDTVRGAK